MKPKTIRIEEATTYRFTFEGGDWCIWTIDDVSGSLSLVSDHGNAAYRWGSNPKHLGAPTLTAFLARSRRESPYVAGKLTVGDTRAYNHHKTEARFRKAVLDERREGHLTKEEARRVWGELSDVRWESVDLALDDLYCIFDADGETLFPEPWEDLVHDASPLYTRILDVYFPVLVDVLNTQPVDKREGDEA